MKPVQKALISYRFWVIYQLFIWYLLYGVGMLSVECRVFYVFVRVLLLVFLTKCLCSAGFCGGHGCLRFDNCMHMFSLSNYLWVLPFFLQISYLYIFYLFNLKMLIYTMFPFYNLALCFKKFKKNLVNFNNEK